MIRCPGCEWENFPGSDLCQSCSHDLTHLSLHGEPTPIQRRVLENSVSGLSLRPPLVVPPDTVLEEVLKKMCEQAVGAVVIGEDQHISGIFTERDFLYRIALHDIDFQHTSIGVVMTPSPVTVSPSHSLAFALREMAIGRYLHLPVVDDQNECVGILSADGILQYLIDYWDAEETS